MGDKAGNASAPEMRVIDCCLMAELAADRA